MLCSKCKKRMAVVFMSKLEGDKQVNEGLCLTCAKEMGVPQIDSMMENMGISDNDIENMNDQLELLMDGQDFEMGGAGTLNPFLQNIFGQTSDKDKGVSSNKTKKDNKDNKENNKKSQNKNKKKFLDNYCTNLTQKAKDGILDRIIGRDREIYRVVQILSRRSKNNPCLIGEPGVGKTAIAEGIAQKIVNGDIPFRLRDKQIYLLDLTALVAGTQFRGQFESRVKTLVDEVKAEGNIILFIDEVHNLVGTGDSEGTMNAGNLLKPALSRGEIQVIGATTFSEYRKYIEKDSALERRFQPVKINEPTIDETIEVLKGIKDYYENHHKVKVSDDIIIAATNLSEKYITDRFLPDKAIDLLDEACSCCSLKSKELTDYEILNKNLKELYDEEKVLELETENIDYEKIANVKANIIKQKEKIKILEPKVINIKVNLDDIAKVIELWTGIPATKIGQSELSKIVGLEKRLKEKIIGQDEAIDVICNAIKRNRVELSKEKRPASFIFVGPTGVGKTELVKVLSKELFDGVDPLIRLDMSEYMEKHTVSKLIGAPPGYVGHEDAGQLTEKVRRKPYSVVLFDEIEKAHPDIMNILLQILDEGRITDSHGRMVNFANTIIAMTSNAGTGGNNSLGFNKSTKALDEEKAKKGLSEFLRPEFLGRVEEIVIFNKLTFDDFKNISKIMLKELKLVLENKLISLEVDDKALDNIAHQGEQKRFGARELRNIIRKQIEDKVADIIVNNNENLPKIIYVTCQDDKIKVGI